MLQSLITSKTRLKLLVKFFVASANTGHLRGLAEEFNESTNAIRKELNQLTEAGFLEKYTQQNKIVYRANRTHGLFQPIQKLIHTYLGIDQYIDHFLEKAGEIRQVALIGDYARGLDSEEIEVLVLGENLDLEYLLLMRDRLKLVLQKNIILYTEKPIDLKHQIILYDDSI